MSDHNDVHLEPTPGERFSKFLKRGDIRETLAWAAFYTAVFVVLGAYFYPKWMPTVMSTDMKAIERLMVVFTFISAPVCGFVMSIFTQTLRHRHKGDTPPPDGPMIRNNRLATSVFAGAASLLTLTAVIYGLIELNSSAEAATTNRSASDFPNYFCRCEPLVLASSTWRESRCKPSGNNVGSNNSNKTRCN